MGGAAETPDSAGRDALDAPTDGASHPGAAAAWSSVHRRVRHDVRSPLAVIIGRCDLLIQGTQGAINPEQRQSLAAVLRNAERLKVELQELADDLAALAPPADRE